MCVSLLGGPSCVCVCACVGQNLSNSGLASQTFEVDVKDTHGVVGVGVGGGGGSWKFKPQLMMLIVLLQLELILVAWLKYQKLGNSG